MTETSYQMLTADRKRDQPPLLKIAVLTFLVKKRKMKLSGVYLSLWEYAEKKEKKNLSEISSSLPFSYSNLKVSVN